jgi:hypothetical protein
VSELRAGGQLKALREALRIRDRWESEMPPAVGICVNTQNNTGVPGVTRVMGHTRKGRLAPRYLAFWVDGWGRRRTRAYAVLKYGEAKAFQLAKEARRRGVLELMRVRAEQMGRGRVPE